MGLTPFTSFTKALSSCLDSQFAEAIFTTGLEDAEPVVVSPPTEEERLLQVKQTYKLKDKDMSEFRFTFDRLDADKNGELS